MHSCLKCYLKSQESLREEVNDMRTERFETIAAFVIMAFVVVMAGLGTHFIDGI